MHLVVVGFDEIVSNKYITCIEEAIKNGDIDGYSVIDLKSQRNSINKRIENVDVKPINVYFIPDPDTTKGIWADESDFKPIFDEIVEQRGKIKVYIATELKAHEEYLRYCLKNKIPSLTEKPLFAPLRNNIFIPDKISESLSEMLSLDSNLERHSVMTLSRYHQIYNELLVNTLKNLVITNKTPITSVHLRHAGGVWNLHNEFETREDHPYKFGYGMLMHGAYHYIDLLTQVLCLNQYVYPNYTLELSVTSYVGFPKDQSIRISKFISEKLDDDGSNFDNSKLYGETDITSTFCLTIKEIGKVLTLGTIALEQTTPSIRNWSKIPEGLYNKNGRISSLNIEAQISTIYSQNITCFDVPVHSHTNIDRIDATAKVITRQNAKLLNTSDYVVEKTYTGLFHSDSNKALMTNWLSDKENRSTLKKHIPVMKFIQVIGESIREPGIQKKNNFGF
ncbi:TPA: hypothetical protein ACINWZ_000563 [Streptococcus agalactiae]